MSNASTLFEEARGATIRGKFWSIKAHAEQKGVRSAELDTLRKFRNTTIVLTANGDEQTSDEALVCVHDLEFFVTVQILDDTPSILSLGRVCEEQGKSVSGSVV